MKLRDGILECPSTGECKIDVDKIARAFRHSCISRWHDEYTLRNPWAGVRVTISKKDAKALIKKLGLVEVTSVLFKNGSVFHARCDVFKAEQDQQRAAKLVEDHIPEWEHKK
jgi:hypothetical protein